jgi:RimJ/RimL family protein N-acetyltransferase
MPDTARYEQKLEAKDGLRLHVRPIRPEDEQLLYEAFERMSERSIYFRFFSPMKRLPHDLAQRLATVDYQDRFALVATSHLPDGHEHIVGVARYDRLQGTNMAEVAVAVIDEYQRRGIGAGLLSLLAQVAREHGLESFCLIVLPENQSMLRLLRRLGWVHQARFRGGVYEITFEI